MTYIDYQTDGQITTITITREKALNALNEEVFAELNEAIETTATDGTRCVILTGAGRSFVAGADISAMLNMTKAEGEAWGTLANSVFRKLETVAPPVIAAVNGFALGGGCELALACDIRIASTKAIFAQPEVGLGVTPGFGGTQRLPRLIGTGLAKEMLYSARRVDAARALEIGLVNAVCEPEELLEVAGKLAADIAAQGPFAVAATKAAVTRGIHLDLDAALALEAELFGTCFETADQREGMGAFLERRPAAPFVGH